MINFQASGKLPICPHCQRQLANFSSEEYPFDFYTQDLWPKNFQKPLRFKAMALCLCHEITKFNVFIDREGEVCYQYE